MGRNIKGTFWSDFNVRCCVDLTSTFVSVTCLLCFRFVYTILYQYHLINKKNVNKFSTHVPYEVFVGKKIYIMYNVGKVLEKQVFTLLVGKIDEHNLMKGVCEYLKTLTKIHKCATP